MHRPPILGAGRRLSRLGIRTGEDGAVSHTHGDDLLGLPTGPRTQVVLGWVTLVVGLITAVGMVVLWPSGEGRDRFDDVGFVNTFVDARIVAATAIDCPGDGTDGGDLVAGGRELVCQRYDMELLSGPDEGQVVSQELYDTEAGYGYSVGDKVVLAYQPDVDPMFQYSIADRQRKPTLFWLAALFAGCVVALGRMRGVAALVGLVLSLVILLTFTLPAIVDGRDALAVALVSASAIAFVAIYLTHGVNALTTVALLGTLASLAATALLAAVFTEAAAITGFAAEESGFLLIGGASIDIQGLILAGMVIGALGAIDDMTVTQASAVAELHRADPVMGPLALYRAGIRIGRDHVASTVNTLVLAYAGASMPLLVLFTVTSQPLASVANGELVATEIVRTLVGSIGLVLSVPLTTWLAGVVTREAQGRAVR